MKLLKFLLRESDKNVYFYLVLGIVSGIANAGILKFINDLVISLEKGIHSIQLAQVLLYFGILAVLFFCQRIFAHYIIDLTQNIILKIRLEILNRIRLSNYADYKEIGQEKIYTSITQDTERISTAAASVVYATTYLVTVIFCLAYLAYVSLLGFALTLCVIGLGILVYSLRQNKIHHTLSTARTLQNKLFKYIDELLRGFKEVKINRKKNDDLYENYITSISLETKKLGVSAITKYIDNSLTGQLFFFLLIGFIIFGLPVFVNDKSTVLSYIFIALYVIGPLEGLMAVVPSITQADIAIDSINDILDKTSQSNHKGEHSPVDDFSNITFENISYNYPVKNNESFAIGPVNLEINKGDLLFIAGGNGSGKTTFFKLLTGLLHPDNGKILIDGKPIGDYNSYRDLFSPIYSDFHLFQHFYGLTDIKAEQVNEYLKMMQLDEKVKFVDGYFSQTNLSTGQRKRLALITSFLENKPIIVLDEWAADQDPHFRQFFYEEMLPRLKKQGKTIIAITHDDKYFDVADRLYKMEYGKFSNV